MRLVVFVWEWYWTISVVALVQVISCNLGCHQMVFDLGVALHHASENPFFRAGWTDMWSKTQ